MAQLDNLIDVPLSTMQSGEFTPALAFKYTNKTQEQVPIGFNSVAISAVDPSQSAVGPVSLNLIPDYFTTSNVTEHLEIDLKFSKVPPVAAEGYKLSPFVKTHDFCLFSSKPLGKRNTLQDWDAFNPNKQHEDNKSGEMLAPLQQTT